MKFCIECGSKENYYAKDMCGNCYRRKHMKKYINTDKWRSTSREAMRKMRAKRYFNLTKEQYDKIRKPCAICGFDIIVELHHIDKDKQNNNLSNLIPLCPNHHRMAHMNLVILQPREK